MIVLDAGEPVCVECPHPACEDGTWDYGKGRTENCRLCHGEGVLDDVPLAEPIDVDGAALGEQVKQGWR